MGAEAKGRRKWSASPRHEAGVSEDNKGGWLGTGKGARGGRGEPRDGGRVG